MYINDSTNASNRRSVDEPRPASTGGALNRIEAVVSRVLEALYINALMTSLSQFFTHVAAGIYLNRALLNATKKGDVERVRELLLRNANPNMRDGDGGTPLHWAAHLGFSEVAALLLEHGAQVDALAGGNTALFYACYPMVDGVKTEAEMKKLVSVLLQAGADPNLAANRVESPLHNAAKWGCAEVVQLLIQGGAQVDGPDGRPYETPLCYAVGSRVEISEDQRYKTVNVLLRAGADPNAWGYLGTRGDKTPLHIAACRGYSTVVNLLLARGAKIDAQIGLGYTALMLAAQKGHLEVVSLLVDYGADKTLSIRMGSKGRRTTETALSLAANRAVWERLRVQPYARFPGPLKV